MELHEQTCRKLKINPGSRRLREKYTKRPKNLYTKKLKINPED
jgi:hypothetical protein